MRAAEALATELECERTGTTRHQLSLEIERLRDHIERTIPALERSVRRVGADHRLPRVNARDLSDAAGRLRMVLESSPFA